MKQIYFITGLMILSLVFTSCKEDPYKGDKNDSPNTTSTENSEDFLDFDLRPYELNATLVVPNDERASIKHHLDSYVWELKIGKQTYITIQDWGMYDGFQEYLEALENQPEEIEFIEKEKTFTLYKLTTGTSKVTYHTAAQHEIEGVNYLFESSKQGLSKDGVEHAVVSVKSVVFND